MAATPPTNITAAPTPAPQRGDRTTFSARVDAFVTWLTAAVAQFNAIATNVYNNAVDAYNQAVTALGYANNSAASAAQSAASAVDAANSANAAASNAAAAKWVTGTNYPQGTVVWSPADPNMLNYRAKVALNPSTVDPFNDSANWSVQAVVGFASVEVLSINADTSLTANSKNVVRVASTVRGASLLLPAGTALVGANGLYSIKNVGTFAIPLRDQSGTLLAIIPGNGGNAIAACEDRTSSASQWMVICPESFPAQAFAAATAEAVTATWIGVSAIPGTTNKALVAWTSATQFKCAIATRNASTGAVTLGTAVNPFAVQSANGAMVCAMTSTTALVAGDNATGVYRTRAMTLDTTTNTITLQNSVDNGTSPNAFLPETVQQLDSTRVAWAMATSGGNMLNIATYAATPTATQTSVNARFSSDANFGIAHVGSGNIMALSTSGNALYTTSGNTPTEASFQSHSGITYISGSTITTLLPYTPQSGNKATWLCLTDNSGVPARDSALTFIPSGTTVPVGPVDAGAFPTYTHKATGVGFVAGTSYCAMGAENGKYSFSLRVMRFANDQLSEIAFGRIEGLPLSRALSNQAIKAASVGSQACIAIGLNQTNQPQVFSMEVIKA